MIKNLLEDIQLDKYYNEDDVDSNGYTKEEFLHIQNVLIGPHTHLTSEELDALLEI